jgi:hypothetical protein
MAESVPPRRNILRFGHSTLDLESGMKNLLAEKSRIQLLRGSHAMSRSHRDDPSLSQAIGVNHWRLVLQKKPGRARPGFLLYSSCTMMQLTRFFGNEHCLKQREGLRPRRD